MPLLRKWLPRYSAFPYWDRCSVEHNGFRYTLVPIHPGDMKKLHATKTKVYGVPRYITLDDENDEVVVYPLPDKDYHLCR